jgi:acetyl esterase/lipase
MPLILVACLNDAIADSSTTFALWPTAAPGALGNTTNDIPTLTVYPAGKTATGAAMVICPGGGYGGLSPHEGSDYALWFSQHGVTCFVLRYRLGSHGYHYPAMFQDVSRAVRLVRSRAAEWDIDPNRLGIIGSSAGGHLASLLLTHFDAGNLKANDPVERESSRPNLGILCYAVLTMQGSYVNQGSRINLLGSHQPPSLLKFLSSERQVTSNTPPCFIWTTCEDDIVPLENSLQFASALRSNNVPFELHIFQKGGHGMALGDGPPFQNAHPWAADCLAWLREKHYAR